MLRPDEADEQLRVYISGLIKAACASGRTPALCFCRSQMRSAWMKNAFGGVHIAQIRNPVDQWASFEVEPYFPHQMLAIALKLRNLHPLSFAHIEAFERFAQSASNRPGLPMEQLFGFFLKQKDFLAVFLLLWIASALQAISTADFVLDIDLLSTDLQYRDAAWQWFAAIGCAVDFSDCASPSGELPLAGAEFERMLAEAAAAIRGNASALVVASSAVVEKSLPSLSPTSRTVLRSALIDRC